MNTGAMKIVPVCTSLILIRCPCAPAPAVARAISAAVSMTASRVPPFRIIPIPPSLLRSHDVPRDPPLGVPAHQIVPQERDPLIHQQDHREEGEDAGEQPGGIGQSRPR